MMHVQINIVWILTMSMLVFFMHAGFGFYEAGMCRIKNTVDTLSHNLLILAVTIVVYWAIGFALMFGSGNGFIGYTGFVPLLLEDNSFPNLSINLLPLVIAFAFTMSFADTPATLIAGSGAERIRFSAVMFLTVLISGLLYPIVGRWIMGGGWLAQLNVPVYDTGSGFVHLTGGCCALAVALILGPRREADAGVEEEEGEQVSSMPLVFLGAFILWLGFFAFNAGFAMNVSASVGLVILNTFLGGASGTVVSMITVKLWTGKARLRTAIVGLLAGNVAITSPAAVVEPWAAVLIGAIAGLLTVGSIAVWTNLRVDDPTEYLTMNVIGGILGLISVGLFASPAIMAKYPIETEPLAGLFYSGSAAQLLSQLLGMGVIIGFVLPGMLGACWLLRSFNLLRVPSHEEREGADKSTHGEKAYEDQ